jgi:hypothetical protein
VAVVADEVVLRPRWAEVDRKHGAVVEKLPELRVKGKAEPVEAYVLKGLGDRQAQ